MTDYRLWIALLLAGCLWSGSGAARAQDFSGGTSGGASSGTFGGASGGNSGSASGGASNGTSGGAANGTSGNTPNKKAAGTSSGTAGGTSDDTTGTGAGASGTGASTSFGSGPAGTGAPAGGRPVLPFSTPGSTPGTALPFSTPATTPGNSLFGAPGSASFGVPSLPGGSNSFPSQGVPGTTENPSSPDNGATPGASDTAGFGGPGGTNGTGPVPVPPSASEVPPGPGNSGAASAFGGGFSGGVTPPSQALPTSTFTMPAAYGQSSQTFSAGIGHLSKPRYHFSASVQFGFDDNVEGTPNNSHSTPAVTQEVEISPAVAPVTVVLPLPPAPVKSIVLGAPSERPGPQKFRSVTFDGTPAVFKKETLSPAIPAQARIQSFVMRANAAMDMQFATRQTFFSLNVTGGIDAYQNRPGGNIDPTGSFALSFIHRITPRLQFSATASASYTSQPTVQTINSATGDIGSYLNVSSKFDLSYRWSPRFSTVSSFSFLGQDFQSSTEKAANNYDTVFGTEFRYLWSPRLTLLTEVRYDLQTYPDDAPRDSRTLYLLLGGEMALSSRLSASARVGESFDSFDNSSGQATTPYAETSVSWRYCPTGFLSWNTRYGFETPPDAQTTVKGIHTGISVVQALSKKLRVSGGITYTTRTTVTGLTPSNVAATAASNSFEQDTVDFNLGIEYTVSPRLVLSASYTYDDVLNSGGIGNYDHNRIFFGFNYGY